jgi:hypothetical protein
LGGQDESSQRGQGDGRKGRLLDVLYIFLSCSLSPLILGFAC